MSGAGRSGGWGNQTERLSSPAGSGMAARTGAEAPASGSSAVTGPPVPWLYAGLAAAVAALVVGALWTNLTGAIVGWLLAGPIAIGLLCVFALRDSKARENPWYPESGAALWLRRGLVVFAFAASALNAWNIADIVARA